MGTLQNTRSFVKSISLPKSPAEIPVSHHLRWDTVACTYVGLHFQKLSYHCCEGTVNESTRPVIYMKSGPVNCLHR